MQAVLSQRLNNTPSNSQPVATYDATRLWAGSKNKLLAHIASRSLKSRALQESSALNAVPHTPVAKVDAAPSAGTAATTSRPPAASAPLAVKAELIHNPLDAGVKYVAAMASAAVTSQASPPAGLHRGAPAASAAAAVPWQSERQLLVPAISNAPSAPLFDFFRQIT